MKRILFSFSLLLCLLVGTKSFAHPGSGIVIDKYGQIYFTDTGEGVWKIDTLGKLSYIPASRFHWMDIDEAGYFASSPKSFAGWFERVTPEKAKPALIMCSDFPFTIGHDGNIYYADTRNNQGRIIRRTADGKETVLAKDKMFQNINGITTGPDGSLYITESTSYDANSIRKISMNGTISLFASFTGKIAAKDLPLDMVASYCRGLVLDAKGFVYVAATGSRSVLKISPQGKITTILQEQSPWTATAVAEFKGEIYVLEWKDVAPALTEVRRAWIPRVRKIGVDGKVTTLATVAR